MTERLLTIMGSGETAPTMVTAHQRLIARVGTDAVLLDTPYGFQENADQLSQRTQDYFATNVGTPIAVASWRRADEPTLDREQALSRIAAADYVFAGPGSPTYALRQWRGTALPDLLAAKLRDGGAVTFASAAALTLGRVTLPVYEIYKAGDRPRWDDGLDLLAPFGLDVAVIPHFDNAEGGNHDTRFCYLGERRLLTLERELPDGCFVLGVDEHTGLVLDLAAGTATVLGNGGVTVRRAGDVTVHSAGTTITMDELRTGTRGGDPSAAHAIAADESTPTESAAASVLDDAERLEATFDAALAAGDAHAAVAAVLELDAAMVAWSADPTQSDETDRARAVFRRMIVRLGDLAAVGAGDPAERIAPFVEAALAARAGAREADQYGLADRIRDALVDAGLELRDAPDGTTWALRSD